MKIYVLTLFPQMVLDALAYSIPGRACTKGLLDVKAVDIRDFSGNKHRTVDDYPYGGGAGMVMAAPPVYRCWESVCAEAGKMPKTLYMSPQGKTFDQKTAEELSKEESLIIICGHYEGLDERAIELTGAEELSIGDYILTGGEIAAIAVIDSVSRLIDGVLKDEAHEDESFVDGLLEYPQYTRPPEFMGKTVPDVLLSGNHKAIGQWRHEQSVLRTMSKRSDLCGEK